MGYVYAMGACVSCLQVFSFNPLRVPSSRVLTGKREPICPGCFERLNALRIARGDLPWELLPGAYEACDESELPAD